MSEFNLPEGWVDPGVQLLGVDNNAFAIMGTVTRGLKRAGNSQEIIDRYQKLAMDGDYDHLLAVSLVYAGDQG